MGARDDAFIDYYTGLYDTQKAERQETQSTGSGTAAQRSWMPSLLRSCWERDGRCLLKQFAGTGGGDAF